MRQKKSRQLTVVPGARPHALAVSPPSPGARLPPSAQLRILPHGIGTARHLPHTCCHLLPEGQTLRLAPFPIQTRRTGLGAIARCLLHTLLLAPQPRGLPVIP